MACRQRRSGLMNGMGDGQGCRVGCQANARMPAAAGTLLAVGNLNGKDTDCGFTFHGVL